MNRIQAGLLTAASVLFLCSGAFAASDKTASDKASAAKAPPPAQWTMVKGCVVASPPVPGKPRIQIFANSTIENGKQTDSARIQFIGIDPVSPDKRADFPGTTMEVAGQATWDKLTATGLASDGYTLVVPISDLSGFLTAVAKGSEIKVTVPAKPDAKTVVADLQNSGNAVSAIRKCIGAPVAKKAGSKFKAKSHKAHTKAPAAASEKAPAGAAE